MNGKFAECIKPGSLDGVLCVCLCPRALNVIVIAVLEFGIV